MSNSNLPPGCTLGDIESAVGAGDISAEEERILSLLEAHGVPQGACDEIMQIIDRLQQRISQLENALEGTQ